MGRGTSESRQQALLTRNIESECVTQNLAWVFVGQTERRGPMTWWASEAKEQTKKPCKGLGLQGWCPEE